MNSDLLQLLVRKVVTLSGGFLIGHGLITASTWTDGITSDIVGAICLLISTGWSIYHQQKLKGGANETEKTNS